MPTSTAGIIYFGPREAWSTIGVYLIAFIDMLDDFTTITLTVNKAKNNKKNNQVLNLVPEPSLRYLLLPSRT